MIELLQKAQVEWDVLIQYMGNCLLEARNLVHESALEETDAFLSGL